MVRNTKIFLTSVTDESILRNNMQYTNVFYWFTNIHSSFYILVMSCSYKEKIVLEQQKGGQMILINNQWEFVNDIEDVLCICAENISDEFAKKSRRNI